MRRRSLLGYFCLAAATVLFVGGPSVALVAQNKLAGMDSYMRLVRIQEALDSGAWFGDAVSRYDSGRGMIVPWSHVLDSVILVIRAPLLLILSPVQALFWAGAVIGPFSVGLLGGLCAWAAAPLARGKWLWTAPVLAASAQPIFDYGLLGGGTHHVPLAALSVGAWGAGGRAAFGDIRAGVLLGLFSGLGIWLSPEAMPFVMMAFGAVFLSWIRDPLPSVAQALAASGSVLLAVIAVALLIDPPHAGRLVPEVDRLSVNFLALALIVCALCWMVRALAASRLSILWRVLVVGAAGALGLALWLILFPQYLRGYAALMTPEEVKAFFSHNSEFLPIRRPADALADVGPAILAVAAALVLGSRQATRLPGILWLYAGMCGGAGLALAFVNVRFSAYPAAAAAIMLPVLLARASDPGLRPWHALLRPALLAGFLVVPLFSGVIFPASRGGSPAAAAASRRCPVIDTEQLLAPYPGAIVVANVNDGSELLYRTRATIVGALYHEGIAGFMRLRAAWGARDLDAVPQAVRATDARFILICPGATGGTAIVDGPATTLLDRLNLGNPPAWLRPVGQTESGWVLYEIDAAGAAG
jgi:hypothetical protein